MKTVLFFFSLIVGSGELMAAHLEKSKAFFQNLSLEKMDLVDDFYASDIIFQDPIHKLSSLDALKSYYKNLYSNVSSIRFEYGNSFESGSHVTLEWKMFLKTPAFNSGNEIIVDGVSLIEFNSAGKAFKHRDYFDMGEFVYERITILGSIIRYIKNRMAGTDK